MKLLCVINPISGGISKSEFLNYVRKTCRYYGISASLFKTTGEEDHRKLKARIADEKPDKIVAAGGDGTFALAALATLASKIPVGIIPLGSSNGMAKELGVKQNVNAAFDDVLKSSFIKPMDVVCINGKYHCIHLADVGLNARIVKAFDADGNRGMLTYGKYLAGEIQQNEQIKYRIKANDKTFEGGGVMIAIGNGRKFGTGVPLSHSGTPFDGKFELMIIKEVNIETIFKVGLSIFDELLAVENVERTIHTDHAVVTFQKPQLLQSDGEVIDNFEKLDISILKGAFQLITHRGNPYLGMEETDGVSGDF